MGERVERKQAGKLFPNQKNLEKDITVCFADPDGHTFNVFLYVKALWGGERTTNHNIIRIEEPSNLKID